MYKSISITGSVQMTKRSSYWQAILNIPVGDRNKTKQKWISTQETEKVKAYKKFVGFVSEYEDLLNDPRTSLEEKLLQIFRPKTKTEGQESDCDGTAALPVKPVDIFSLRPNQIKFVDLLKNWRHAFDDIEGTTIEGYEENFVKHIIPYFENRDLYLLDVKRRNMSIIWAKWAGSTAKAVCARRP
jgi:hypothetical protein